MCSRISPRLTEKFLVRTQYENVPRGQEEFESHPGHDAHHEELQFVSFARRNWFLFARK
jgi:hypothetical protein